MSSRNPVTGAVADEGKSCGSGGTVASCTPRERASAPDGCSVLGSGAMQGCEPVDPAGNGNNGGNGNDTTTKTGSAGCDDVGGAVLDPDCTTLPKLEGTEEAAFADGEYMARMGKAGEEFYRAEKWNSSGPGRWLGTESVSSPAEANAAYDIFRWGNPGHVMRTYRLTEDTLMYFGRVAGGEGYQALLPAGSNPSALLKLVNVRVL